MTRLVLIRHGITKWNKEKRYCGRIDIGLSRDGKAQARLLAKTVSPSDFDKVYCSSKKRALETARIIFKKAKLIKKSSLREINFGVLEGSRHNDILKKYGDIYTNWLKDPFRYNIPKAEPMDAFGKRVRTAMADIARSNPGKIVAVVCHGGVIGIFSGFIKKDRNFWRCVPSSASVTVVEYIGGKPVLKKFNDTRHLEATGE